MLVKIYAPIFTKVTLIPLVPTVTGVNKSKTTQKTTQKILGILRQNPSASRKEIARLLGGITVNGDKEGRKQEDLNH